MGLVMLRYSLSGRVKLYHAGTDGVAERVKFGEHALQAPGGNAAAFVGQRPEIGHAPTPVPARQPTAANCYLGWLRTGGDRDAEIGKRLMREFAGRLPELPGGKDRL